MRPSTILEGDPAEPLLAAAHRPAAAQEERRQHLRQRPTPRDPAPRRCAGSTTRMPASRAAAVAASHSRHTSARKPLARGALLRQLLLAPVPVDADARGAHQHPGLAGHARQPLAQRCACPRCGCGGFGPWPRASTSAPRSRPPGAPPRPRPPAPPCRALPWTGSRPRPHAPRPRLPRTSRRTRWPPVVRKGTSALPTSPVAPVTATVSGPCAAKAACRRRSSRVTVCR